MPTPKEWIKYMYIAEEVIKLQKERIKDMERIVQALKSKIRAKEWINNPFTNIK